MNSTSSTSFVVLGAGAVGAVVGGRLHQAGHAVTLVARGAHHDQIAAHGLRVESPAGVDVVSVPVVDDVADVDWDQTPVVLLGVKSQHTAEALAALASHAPAATPVVCLQNGIANEPTALRFFADVYGVHVACPAGYLEPGVVQAWSSPITALLDVGRYPHGTDGTAETVAAAFRSAGIDSQAVHDIMRWKRRKLINNLGNALQLFTEPGPERHRLRDALTAEAEAVFAAAGDDVASAAEDAERRGTLLHVGEIAGRQREGSSTWQSVARGSGSVETAYLNGEVIALGRLHGVPTPVNAEVQRRAFARLAQART